MPAGYICVCKCVSPISVSPQVIAVPVCITRKAKVAEEKFMLFYFGRALFRILFRLVCRWEITGRENLPASGGVILAPNHISHLDPPLVGSAVTRPVYFMAKAELFRVPVLGSLIRRTHAFPVNRGAADRQAIRHAQELLAQGQVLVMFPEGHRSEDGCLQTPELGVAMIAARAGVPVVPVAVMGSNRALPKGAFFLHPAKIRVQIGKPVFCDSATTARASREMLESFTDKIMEGLRQMLPIEMGGTAETKKVENAK
jgi:1-acyl-sn-glycerol-3-phosphate acyltransferase